MKVAMVCSQTPPVYGGAGAQALTLARQLRAQSDVRVTLYTLNQGLAPRAECVDGVEVRRAPGEKLARSLPRRGGQVVRTLLFTAWLVRVLARSRHDVYHVHGNYWFSLVPYAVAKLRRVPLVVKVTRLGEDDTETVRAKRVGALRIGRLYAAPLLNASAVIALNDEIARRHRTYAPSARIDRIPNGVDVSKFATTASRRMEARCSLGIDPTARVVLFVGYLAPHKGVEELLAAWRDLPMLESGDLLLLVGPAGGFYRELSERVTKLAQRAGRSESVRLLQHVPVERMPDIYAAGDVFVLPTRAEGMPNSLLEALAAGLEVVVSDVPGVADVVETVPSATVLPELTLEELKRGLAEALRRVTPAYSDRRSRLPEGFAVAEVARRYAQLYDDLRPDPSRWPWLQSASRQKGGEPCG